MRGAAGGGVGEVGGGPLQAADRLRHVMARYVVPFIPALPEVLLLVRCL
jgi:hypothetical protein